ncbi:hypothetical protein T440DRAFT_466522 [Plenodomus tracheiphilus IPT5]|uniref:Heterokaryon incompatibility domain-containing protein n=1 Tax=Plenodomus tracheiphilus IPT5 TaxID=1408161 RepID=A0A6A7BC75_9PLEO|nr:hypothetical protein T440DRAFT_466522 [Plenodomus tracheiphilus IPT5]
MEYPKNLYDAQRHIALIRKGKGFDGPDTNTSDLESALIILSEQLYQKSTHFLSELIQNADDNSYQTATPSLAITYTHSNRTLRIDCNEIGFSKANVEAICKIGRSTKAKVADSRRYIGEKGIGFKSVFKVANVVYVQSGYYSFKFDKHARLGMIAPVWTDFPETTRSGNTSILLQLSADNYPEELEYELKSLDPRLLLFLRKLKQLEVMGFNKLGDVTTSTLRRRDVAASTDGAKMVHLHHDAALSRFKVIEHVVKNMPQEPKRVGCTSSEVLLAFAVGPEGEPWIAPQKVYAFLPVRDYGFKFLIQADFLLIASREDINVSSAWNRYLLAAIPEAFLKAVHTFNKGELRYQWTRYLPDHRPHSGFFEQLMANIVRTLSQSRVIESWSGVLSTPCTLKYLHGIYRDLAGDPLIQLKQPVTPYISEKYSAVEVATLERLGVRALSAREFVEDLRLFVQRAPAAFRTMSHIWHSSLASALLWAMEQDSDVYTELKVLPIIPLKNGHWVASASQQTYFASLIEDMKIPHGTLIGEIDPSAAVQLSRRNFYHRLGSMPYSRTLICETIVREQQAADFDPKTIRTNDHIARAVFLFESGWRNQSSHDFWVATEDGSARRGSETYTQSTKPLSAKILLTGGFTAFNFLHRGYTRAPATILGDWTRWLTENLGLAEFPRLVITLSPKLVLATDFRVLRKENPILLLLVLRDHWDQYSRLFLSSGLSVFEDEDAKVCLRATLAAVEVPCVGGDQHPLGLTTLPNVEVLSGAMNATSFLDVPEPQNPQWHFLGHFGVIVHPGIDQFIRYLEQVKATPGSEKRVPDLYQQLQALAPGHVAEIREIFASKDLIFIPSKIPSKPHSWVKSSTCVWSGPKWLRKTPILDGIYPELSSFFCGTLGLHKTTWRTIISEAECIHAADDLTYLTEVFRALDALVVEADSSSRHEIIEALSEAYIFPIDAGRSGAAFDYMSSARDPNLWFIADRLHLRQSFYGLVPLLALNVDAADKISRLISEIGLRNRLLTQAAGSDAKTEGETQVHAEFTAAFRAKARYIARILPASNALRNDIVTKLCGATVHASETVSIQWTVKLDGVGEVQGRADSGRVKISYQGDSMNIYLRHRDAHGGIYPIDLRENLAQLCSFDHPTQIRLLEFVLNEPDPNEILGELSRRGFPEPSSELAKIFDTKPPGNFLDADYTPRKDPVIDEKVDQYQFQGHTPNTRRYRSRRADEDTPDNVQEFLQKFNMVNVFQGQLAQPWAEAGADNLLAHVCKLDDVNPWTLLPRNRNQWDELLKAKGKPPGVATSTFWSANRHVQGKNFLGDRRNVRNTYPAVVLQDHRRNMVIKISNAIDNLVTDESLFAAEHYVSRLFEKRLGNAYIPSLHWTSPLRIQAGLLPYFTDDETTSTFTFGDTTAAFAALLRSSGYKVAGSGNCSTTFHIEVIPSDRDLADKFCIDPEQIQKAWRCHTEASESQPEIFVLARVVNIRTKPRVAFFVDPWRLHAEGHMNLESASQYEATLSSMVAQRSCIYINEDAPSCESLTVPHTPPGKESVRWYHKRKVSRTTPEPPRIIPQPPSALYTYQRLQLGETRLLELRPGRQDAPLHGEVHHINTEHTPSYHALSYVWGPATKSYALQTTQGPIQITASLCSALRRIRKEDEVIHVWVDAVCINQDDDHEKATQVRMLPSIFQSAEMVLCWIGEERDDSSAAIQTLLQIRTLELAPQQWPTQLPEIPNTWKDGVPPVNDPVWWSIQNLFEREWFSRVWVIQEVVLAKELKLICGNYEMDWEDVIKAVEICLDDQGGPLPIECSLRQIKTSFGPVHTLGLTKRAFENKNLSKRFSLISLLDVFTHSKSTKPRDKFFALLGIASDSTATAFDPDYSSSLAAIIRRIAHEFVRRGNVAELLYRAGSTKSVRFTSWIPNWVANHPCRTISTWRGSDGIFAAASKLHLHANVSPADNGILQITGSIVDTITRTSLLSLRGKDIIILVNDANAMIDQLPSYPTGETLSSVKLKVPIGSAVAPHIDNAVTIEDMIGSDVEDDAMLKNAFEWQDNITKIQKVEDIVTFLEAPKASRDQSYKYWLTAAALFERLGNGRFFVTKRGYVGIAPDRTHIGDQICIMHGAAVPFVIRPVKHQGLVSVHSLIGETYVHGIMYGEALAFDNVKAETLYLK